MNFLNTLRSNLNQRRAQFVLLLCTAALIVATGIYFKTPFFRLIPLFFSLFIMLYQSEANRYAYLFGGLNSVIYAVVYYSIGIYASAASALLFSCPMQIMTFLLWKKKAYKKSVIFRKMSVKHRVLTVALFLVAWGVVFGILKAAGSDYAILDNTAMLLGILTTILTLFAFVEYSAVNLLHISVGLALQIQVIFNDISNMPFFVYMLYCFICHIRARINVKRLCREQSGIAVEADGNKA